MIHGESVRTLIVSDFNTQSLAGCLNNDSTLPVVDATVSPFGQVMQSLTDLSLPCWQTDPQVAIVWTQPHRVLRSFKLLLEYSPNPIDDLLEEVDSYCDLLVQIADKLQALLVPTWVIPSYYRGFGMIDLKSEYGISNQLMRANLRLIDNLNRATNIYILNSQRWVEVAGASNAHNPKLWYMGKLGFGNQVVDEAVKDVKAALLGIAGHARKLIVVDLDDTLWGGIVGDDGWEDLRLGGHDPIGEALVDFQAGLKALKNRGTLLGIVSKNEESIALEAISSHPEMVLRLEDFAGWRINWNDKADNIVDLVLDLKLGLQSVVFIDDSPVERLRVSAALPEVLVPEWPTDQLLYKKALFGLACFDTPVITKEDLGRADFHAAERKRALIRNDLETRDEWLCSLETQVIVEPLNSSNLPRANQLMNKTNQMNLASRRMNEMEMWRWAKQENHHMWTFRVVDKFGDAGLTGVASIQRELDHGTVTDFVLSCRVIGRRVEETIIHFVTSAAKQLGVHFLNAQYIPTSRNQVCLEFWEEGSGFAMDASGHSFILSLGTTSSVPDGIELVVKKTE